MTFRVVHARLLHPSRRGLWYLHEHSARITSLAMTEERWQREQPFLKMTREVLRWQTGPRWAVVADPD